MSETPTDLRYTSTHEWARKGDDGNIQVGISDYAQHALGDVVFIELPEIGTQIEAKDEVVVVESVKAASDIYAPVAGEIVRVNDALEDEPQLLNSEPYDKGWIFEIQPSDANAMDELLSAEQYQAHCAAEEDH